MNQTEYNILWIDDEHELLSATKGRAKRNGINLIPFKSLNGGISELERNYPFYDGVLLDAKFFENEDDEQGSEDTEYILRANELLLSLKKKFKIFVLTGQAEAYEDRTFNKVFKNVYRKGSDDEIDRLFNDIKEAAQLQIDTQIRLTHRRVFDVCTERYIGESAGIDLLSLLKTNEDINFESWFNSIRKIIEDLFIAFNKYNLLPSDFIHPNVALNQSSIFLAGQEQYETTDTRYKQYKHSEETHLPFQIAYYLRNILSITQSGSHRSEVSSYVNLVRTPYLFNSLLYQLLDILVWFKIYVDSGPKIENWTYHDHTQKKVKYNFISGRVINKNTQKGYSFFKPETGTINYYIPAHLVSKYSLEEGSQINAEIEEYKDTSTGEIRYRVKGIKL